MQNGFSNHWQFFDMGKLRKLTWQKWLVITNDYGFYDFFYLMKKVPMYNFIPMLRANLPYRGHLVRPKSAWENVTVLTKKVQYAIERRTIKNSIEWKGKKNNHEPVQIRNKKVSHTCAMSFQNWYWVSNSSIWWQLLNVARKEENWETGETFRKY